MLRKDNALRNLDYGTLEFWDHDTGSARFLCRNSYNNFVIFLLLLVNQVYRYIHILY